MSEQYPIGQMAPLNIDQQVKYVYDTGDDALIQQTEELAAIKQDQLLDIAQAELIAAQTELHAVSDWLVSESIDEGDPGRNIADHPEYIAALEKYNRKKQILDQLRAS